MIEYDKGHYHYAYDRRRACFPLVARAAIKGTGEGDREDDSARRLGKERSRRGERRGDLRQPVDPKPGEYHLGTRPEGHGPRVPAQRLLKAIADRDPVLAQRGTQ